MINGFTQLTVKCPYDEKSHGEVALRRGVLTAKCPYGEVSVRRTIRTAKCPYGVISYGKMSHGDKSYGAKF